eukprot:g63265.t1
MRPSHHLICSRISLVLGLRISLEQQLWPMHNALASCTHGQIFPDKTQKIFRIPSEERRRAGLTTSFSTQHFQNQHFSKSFMRTARCFLSAASVGTVILSVPYTKTASRKDATPDSIEKTGPPPQLTPSQILEVLNKRHTVFNRLGEVHASSDKPLRREHFVKSIESIQFQANDQLEDTMAIRAPLKTAGATGLLLGVFDGHSGPGCSYWCRDNLFDFIEKQYLLDCQSWLEKAVPGRSWSPLPPLLSPSAFMEADKAFLDQAETNLDFSGACVCVVSIQGRTVLCANSGDCRALIGRRDPKTGNWIVIPLSEDHQLHNPAERARLVAEHPNEKDITKQNRIKGRLEPTRTLGDGTYKRNSFFQARPRMMAKYLDWTVPYVTAYPEIRRYELRESDGFLVMGTDGLYDELSNQEVVQCIGEYLDSRKGKEEDTLEAVARIGTLPESVAANDGMYQANATSSCVTGLLLAVLNKAAEAVWKHSSSPWENISNLMLLEEVRPGLKRRRVHDDISVAVVFFDTDALADAMEPHVVADVPHANSPLKAESVFSEFT